MQRTRPARRLPTAALGRLIALLAAAVVVVPLGAAPASAALPDLRDSYGPGIEGYASYDGQTTCASSVRPGVAEIADFLKAAFPQTNPWDYIRSCSVGGPSEHKDGRAIDWMLDVHDPAEKAVADAFFAWLFATDKYGNTHAMARRLGIMYMVWNGKMWRAYRDQNTWDGSSDRGHYDHIHISFSRAAAERKTSFFTNPAPADTRCIPGSSACPVDRLAGSDRYGTSVAIGREAAPSARTVVLASGEDDHLVDGLVAAPLARAVKAPVLLTRSSGLPGAVASDLKIRKATRAYVVGAQTAIGDAVAGQLKDLGIAVTRISGRDRYSTAAAVANQLRAVKGTSLPRAVVASGRDANLVDALGAGGPAAATGQPVLLTRGELPGVTAKTLDRVGASSVNVVGGTSAVPAAVETDLRSNGQAVSRLAGADRYQTAAQVAGAYASSVSPHTVTVASGAPTNLVDALPAGALGQVILLSRPSDLPGVSIAWIGSRSDVDHAEVVGGEAAVGQPVVDALGNVIR